MGIKKMADIKRIEILIDKYWRGESTRTEEAALRDYFTGNDVAAHLKYLRPLFIVLQQDKSKQLGKDFDDGLQQQISQQEKTAPKGLKFFSTNIIKLAAAVILILTVTYVFRTRVTYQGNNNEVIQLGTFNDPEEAYEQVRQSLLLVSTKLNKGKGYMEELSKFNKGATLFIKQKKKKTEDK